jgi:hypothetical protein
MLEERKFRQQQGHELLLAFLLFLLLPFFSISCLFLGVWSLSRRRRRLVVFCPGC